MGGQDPCLQEGGQDPGHQVGGRDHGHQGEDQILTHSEDNVPRDNVNAKTIDVPNDVDGDHTHPDEGDVPKTPEEGDVQKSLDEETVVKQQNAGNTALTTLQMSHKMSRGMSEKTTKTFQAETPAGKETKTDVNSPPTAKRTKSKVEKKKAKPPEASKPALTYMKKAADEPIKELEVVTTKLTAKAKSEKPTVPPDPNVTTNAALPTAAVKTPAEDKPEEAEEEAVDEPRETVIKPVVEEKPATDTPPLPVATEASQHRPAFKDIATTHMVIPKQNRMTAKNNQAAQVQETYSKVGASLTDDDDAFTERVFPFNPDPSGTISDDTKVPNMHETAAGAVNEPKVF